MFVFASYADPINDVARKMLTEDVKTKSAELVVNDLMGVRQKEDLPRSLWEKYDEKVKHFSTLDENFTSHHTIENTDRWHITSHGNGAAYTLHDKKNDTSVFIQAGDDASKWREDYDAMGKAYADKNTVWHNRSWNDCLAGINEPYMSSPEHLEELSKETLGSYINKAAEAATKAAGSRPLTKDSKKRYAIEKRNNEKSQKRLVGISKAVRKLMETPEPVEENKRDEYLSMAAQYAAKKKSATGEERVKYDRLEKDALRKAGVIDTDNNGTEIMETRLLGQGMSKAALDSDTKQSDNEYIVQRQFKDKWKTDNPGKKWPGYEAAGFSSKKLDEKDEGKPGKNFDKIADKAAKEYGSKEAGKRVAGAIRAKILAKLHEADDLGVITVTPPVAAFQVNGTGKEFVADGVPFTASPEQEPEVGKKVHPLQSTQKPPTLEESVQQIMREGISAKVFNAALKATGNNLKQIKPEMLSVPTSDVKAGEKKTLPTAGNFVSDALNTLKRTTTLPKVNSALVSPITKADREQFNKTDIKKSTVPFLAEEDEQTLDETAFGDAFKQARAQGLSAFTFNGKSFNTRLDTETNSQWKANMAKVAPTPQPRPADRAPVVNANGQDFNPNGMDGDRAATAVSGKATATGATASAQTSLQPKVTAASAPVAPKPATPTVQPTATAPKPTVTPTVAPGLIDKTFSSLPQQQLSAGNLNQALVSAVSRVQQQAAGKVQPGAVLKEQTESNLLQPKDFYKDGGKELNTIASVLAKPRIDLSGNSPTPEVMTEEVYRPVKKGDVLDGFEL